MKALTDNQQSVMDQLEVGKKTDVGTSQYLNTFQTNYFNPSIIEHPAVFRGLAARGLIAINDTSWRMMTVTRLI
jgi:hypothetical protein